MRRVNDIKHTTQNRFLNMFELDMKSEDGKHSKYFVASRAEKIEDLKISTRENKADGVIIYSIYKEHAQAEEKVVLIKQYRCPIDDYIYEFPAGLVDEGEDFKTAGKRELKEETGLDITNVQLCGVKQFTHREGKYRYIVFFYKTDKYSGELKSSDEGKVFWIKREDLNEYVLAEGFIKMLEVFENDNLSENFHWQENGEWKVQNK